MNSFNTRGELEFPLSYVLKVIFTDAENEINHTTDLESLLDSLTIPRGTVSSKQSGKGKYVSLSIPVDIESRDKFDNLYRSLNTLPAVKCAI
ncbi:MAG: DUF493 domain-containing protein [Spirochaetales bacterium]|nr:DUF493 domain-containing protein [Spirochaetales bacterium]